MRTCYGWKWNPLFSGMDRYKGYAMLESTVAGGAEETCNQASYIYVGHAFTTGLAYAAHHSTSVDVLSYNWGTVQGSLLDLRKLETRK